MTIRFSLFAFGLFGVMFLLHAQTPDFRPHILYLASDSLGGRLTGTHGEKLASEYIAEVFRVNGIVPVPGLNGYYQEFAFSRGKALGPENSLRTGKVTFKQGDRFYPLAFSGSGKADARVVDLSYGIGDTKSIDDYKGKKVKGKIVLIRTGLPASVNPHTEPGRFADLKEKAAYAASKGAAAVIFFNPDTAVQNPVLQLDIPVKELSIPAVFLADYKYASKLVRQKISLSTDLYKLSGTGRNVLGWIDHKAPNTVLIGAHFDHLGLGDDRHSRYRGEPQVHNGADDNASGVSMMLELGRALQTPDWKANNYLLVAFSGEELGLWGSKWLADHIPQSVGPINYMLNFDMVGRVDSQSNALIINGTGTSPQWSTAIKNADQQSLQIKTTESGVGPSDHTSFYLKNIPVLHFFSGNHEDYHKPGDDEHKINYAGMNRVFVLVKDLMQQLNTSEKIAFTKTKDQDNDNAPRFTVTLGVVPDYTYDGEGMRIDAVTEGKTASAAGLKPGDVVLQLGMIKVTDMMSYMKALSYFRKGDKTRVRYMRGKEEQEKELQF